MGVRPFRALELRRHHASDHLRAFIESDRLNLMTVGALNDSADRENQFDHDAMVPSLLFCKRSRLSEMHSLLSCSIPARISTLGGLSEGIA